MHSGRKRVFLSAAILIGILAAAAPAFAGYRAKMVVDGVSGGQPTDTDDLAVYNYLLNRGDFELVQAEDDNSDIPGNASGFNLIIISATVSSTNIGGDYKDVTPSVLCWEPNLNYDFNIVGSALTLADSLTWGVISLGHYITTPFVGNVQILSSTHSVWSAYTNGSGWGTQELDPDLQTLVVDYYNNSHALLTVGEAGVTVYNGDVLEGRRAFIYLDNTTASSTWSDLTSNGRELFGRTINWLLYWDLATPTPTASASATPTNSATFTVTPTITPTSTPTPVWTPTYTVTPTRTPRPFIPTATPTPFATAPGVLTEGLVVYPNPARTGPVSFQFAAERAGTAEFTIYNSAYQLVTSFACEVPAAGVCLRQWSVDSVAPGVYLCRVKLSADGFQQTFPVRKLVVLK